MSRSLFKSLVVAQMLAFAITAQALPTNNELKIGISQEFENMNPAIGSMAATSYMASLAIRNLVYLNAEGKWTAQLAKTIPSIENGLAKLTDGSNGVKGLKATWEIKDTASWGDGTPVTCADIKFTWDVGSNSNVSVGSRDPYLNIEKISWDPAQPKKCEITYKKAKWDFFKETPTPMPAHIEGPVLAKFGKKKEGYDQNSNYNKSPTNPGLYNGPYLVKELKLGSHVSFEPNPHFYGSAPKVKKIIFKLIPNTGTLEANLRSATIDMVSPLGFAFDQALAFDKKVKADRLPFKVIFQPGVTYEHIDMNLDNPILKDARVRQALLHAINRDELTKALFEGKQQPAIHSISPIDPWFTNDPKKVSLYPFNRRQASRLLDEAGWKMGKDGYRSKDGQKLSLQFMTTAGNKTRETVQTLLQSQWKSVGVEITIKNEPARVFFGETTRKRGYGALAMYAWISSPESSQRSTLHSSSITSEKNSWSGQNYSGWANKTADTLLDAIDLEFDSKKRTAMVHKVLAEYTKDLPVIPLYYRSDVAVIPANMVGYKIPGHLFYETNDAENWDLTTSLK